MSGAFPANLAVAPVLVPLAAGVLSLLGLGRPRLVRAVALASVPAQLLVAALLLGLAWREGAVVLAVGDWPPPFGIALVVDLLAAVMLALAALAGGATIVAAVEQVEPERERAGLFAFLHFLLAGVNGAFVTGDLFNLFVWFEVMLMASYVLVALGATPYQLRQGITYMAINAFASTLFLVGVAVLYRVGGTLNMADLALRARDADASPILAALSLVLLFVFATKAGLFPLYVWLPRPYDASPSTVTPALAALLTKVGVYALLRSFGMIFVAHPSAAHALLLALAAATALLGALGALAERTPKRVFTFAVVGQIGFAVMGLGLGSPAGLAASVFLVVHDVVVLAALFLAVAAVERRYGRDPDRQGGLRHLHPGLAALFLGAAISLAGAPPFSGFFSKLALLQAAVGAGHAWLAALAVVASFLTLLAMVRLFVTLFWGEPPAERAGPIGPLASFAIGTLVALSLGIGLAAGPVQRLAEETARRLVEPDAYVTAVLGHPR